MEPSRPSFFRRSWPLLALAFVGLVLLAGKLSVRSAATGEPLIPGLAAAPIIGPGPTATATPGTPRVRVRVQVVDAAGQPVPQALVEARNRFNAVAGSQETGFTGEAILSVPQDRDYTITARKQGFTQGRVESVDASNPIPLPTPTALPNVTESPRRFTILQGPTVQIQLRPAADPATNTVPARLFVGHTSARLSLIDASSNLLLKHSEPLGQGRPTYVAQARDPNRLFAAWSGSQNLLVVDSYDLTVERQTPVGPGGITSLAVDPRTGNVWIATVASDSPESTVLAELDPSAQEVRRRLPLNQLASGLRFQPDGSVLYATSRSTNALLVVDPLTATVTRSIRLPQTPTDIAFSASGRSLFVANLGSERLVEIDAVSGDVIRTMDVGTGAVGVVPHPDGRRLFVVNQLLGYVQVIDALLGQVIDLIPVGRAPQGAVLTADAGGLYVANAGSGTISLVDLDRRAVRETLTVGGQPSSLLLVRTA